MTIKSKYNEQTFEIKEDLPEVGFYLYVYDESGKCIADYLQNTLNETKEFAFEEYQVPIDSWTTLP